MKDNKVSVAVIGIGYWGPNLVRTLLSIEDCHLAWICEQSSGRQEYGRQLFPNVSISAHIEEVLDDPDVDAIFIATPVPTHYEIASAALKAGKHIFVEKPLASSSDDASALVDLAEKKDRRLAVGHIFAYHPAITAMKELVELGRVGALCYAESDRVNVGPPASKLDVIWDLAVHDVAIMVHLLGMEPDEVTAFGQRCVHPHLCDVAFLRLRFRNGFFSNHHVSWLSPDKVRRLSLFGASGSLTFDDSNLENKLRFVDRGIDTRLGLKDSDVRELSYRPGAIEYPDVGKQQPLRIECEDFLKCVQKGSVPTVDGRSGLAVVRVLEAAQHSIFQNSSPISLQKAAMFQSA